MKSTGSSWVAFTIVISGFALGVATADRAAAQVPVPVGPELAVNAFTLGNQEWPSVAAGGDGGSFVVWSSDGRAVGHGPGLYGRHFDAAGVPGTELRVDTGDEQPFPVRGRVAGDRAGNFVAVWAGHGNPDGSGAAIFARRYDRTGQPASGELPVSATIAVIQTAADVAMDPAGGFCVVWMATDRSQAGVIQARLFTAAGQALTPEITVSRPADSFGLADVVGAPRVAADPLGGYFVTWAEGASYPDTHFLFRRYDAQGSPRGPAVLVRASQSFPYNSLYNQDSVVFPVPGANGSFSIVWNGIDPAPSPRRGLFAQRYDPSGAPQGDAVALLGAIDALDRVGVAADAVGGALVTWTRIFDGLNVLAQDFDGAWQPRGAAFQVNTYTPQDQRSSAVASSAAGNFIVAWTSGDDGGPILPPSADTQDGSYNGVFAQRLAPPPCTDDRRLCLAGGRFEVQVGWRDPHASGAVGVGRSIPLTGDTGAFWFFSDGNPELVVKVLDGRRVNGKFWVFYGALSDVEYDIQVTDTASGERQTYHNPPFTLASRADTAAFPRDGAAKSAVFDLQPPLALHASPVSDALCGGDPLALCLQYRFTVAVTFTDPTTGAETKAHAVSLGLEAGYFWFFDAGNIELLVKVLDGRSLNGNFWVLYGALSDIEYSITVTDVQTGRARKYVNPAHTMASHADTAAFSDIR